MSELIENPPVKRPSSDFDIDRIRRMYEAERCYRNAMQLAAKLPEHKKALIRGEEHLKLLVAANDQCCALKLTADANHAASFRAYAAWKRIESTHKPLQILWLSTIKNQSERLRNWEKRGGAFSLCLRALTFFQGSKIKKLLKYSKEDLREAEANMARDETVVNSSGKELAQLEDKSKDHMAVIIWVAEKLSEGGQSWTSSVPAIKESLYRIGSGLRQPSLPIEERINSLRTACDVIRDQIALLQVQSDFSDSVAARIKSGLSLLSAVKHASQKFNIGINNAEEPIIQIVPNKSNKLQEPPLTNISDIIGNFSGKIRKSA